ncbi:SAM-dependent methyltransferase [Methylacidiphilum sp. Yel]|jgi:ubiquinone/menaquinone biosynthesis C-methylase UbiE|uniref:class I SAM-dependent methyltransferase n=1 Tax=Methylacidiphilum sp. Yel TaxID=1847730 RepID=UPI00106C94FD|nr:class I SAM-dependent methyltransferase [Methylacidiphilum sp. Yel]TFE66885.1 SAM-dependent methyltransferase [Methylacidiphilum sp. Yel]
MSKIENNITESQKRSRSHFSSCASYYQKGHILKNTEDLEKTFEDIKLQKGMKALDIATGNGYTAFFLAEHGLDVTACDITETMLEGARKTAIEKNYDIKFVLHSAEKLPYPNESFDLVCCRYAAHHFGDQKAFVRESARVLKKDGLFVLIDGTVPNGASEAYEWLDRVEKLRDYSHVGYRFESEWKEYCREAGLEPVKSLFIPFKQDDIEWYFRSGGTSVENQQAIYKMVKEASERVKKVLKIGWEDGKPVWWWIKLALVARKTLPAPKENSE